MKFKYKSADKTITWNEDKDLKPITFQLPEPPELETIEGYGLPPEDQFWVHKPMPPKLAKINSLTHSEDGKVALTPRMKMEMLERNQEFYHDEILWIEREWERRENGYWFFNNGKPTMITGDHYFYLRYWPIEGQLPDYRNRDRRWFWFWTMVENDDNCFGFNNPKQRREGATIKVCSIRWGRAAMYPYFNTGLQSKDEDHASTVHYSEIVEVSKAVPFFFQPITDNAQNVWREIRFFSPTSKVHPDYGYSALNSFIDYKDSGPKAYDGLKKRLLHNDEAGKCLGFNTLVLMYDGSYKPVQDIIVGDQLMGLDSTPRTVKRLFRGEDEMYRVIPNKGDSWTCNAEHILTTKSASDQHAGQKHPKGSIINASVNEYLTFSHNKQRHMMLYKGTVDYPNKEVDIEPYFLGLWLGDGSMDSVNLHICNTDTQIVDYLRGYSERLGLNFVSKSYGNKGCTTHLLKKNNTANNPLLDKIRKYCGTGKCIPDDYLFNSRDVRLKLLAGIIDTDGHLSKKKNSFEITQVRKELSYRITHLARSLGFSVVIKKKKTSIASIGFQGEAYRISIYGNDLHDIPTLVPRKQAPPHSTHKNRRNPLHTGFKVVPEGRGNYYGFEIDKDHLFMLHDFTVVHNCSVDIDINERVRIQIPCLTNIVRNSPVKGKMINTSTTGEMESGGGGRFKSLCDASDYHKRNDNGLTMSGLYTLFQSAREGMEGIDPKTNQPFIDKYGEANEEAIQRYLTAKREALRKAGRVADYIEECRQYPLEYADSWKTSARNCVFNLMKIEDRLEYYRNGNNDKIQGNFEWSSGPDSKVRFVPSEVGRFYLSLQLDPNKANRMIIDPDGRKIPGNPNRFYAGGDPFKFSKTKNKGSFGGGAVYWKYDHAVDAGKPDYMKHESNRFVCTYKYRPITIEDYGEDMIKMCVYFGCTMFPETNVDFLYKYFEDRGYGGYLYYIFDPRKGRFASMPGQYTHVKEKEQIFSVTQSYIERHALRERHDELLKEWKEIVDELNDFDLAVAAGLALIAAGDIDEGAYEEEDTSATDIDTYYQRFKY